MLYRMKKYFFSQPLYEFPAPDLVKILTKNSKMTVLGTFGWNETMRPSDILNSAKK